MQTRYYLNGLFLLVMLGAATAAEAQVQPELAKRYFDEATKLCERGFTTKTHKNLLSLRSFTFASRSR